MPRSRGEKRDELIEHLCSLAPVLSLLDQILWHFGTDEVAEVTGRSRRIVKDSDGKLKVQNRPASANITETQAFMDDKKRILIFSDAGGTGGPTMPTSTPGNQRLSVHYLAEGRAGARPRPSRALAAPTAPTRPSPHCPARCIEREGSETLPVHHRAPPRHARRHHARPASDRRAGHVPARGQSGKQLRPRRAAQVLCRIGSR